MNPASLLEAASTPLPDEATWRAVLHGALSSSELSSARLLLDAGELRFGPWGAALHRDVAATSVLPPAHRHAHAADTPLYHSHAMVLLALDDLPACKFLRRRLDPELVATIPAFRIHQALHDGVSGARNQ